MEQAICKCINPNCSQSGLEKSALITIMYGYGRGESSVVCPECESLLVVNRISGPDSHLIADI